MAAGRRGKGGGRGGGSGPAKAKRRANPAGRRRTSTRVKTARGRPTASSRWLERQLNDPYVEEAQRLGYRSRAAFKLVEIDDKARILKAGQRVVDLGAAPGGWTQVAVERVRPEETGGQIVALDRLGIDAIPGATILLGDFEEEAAEAALLDALGGKADVVLSDLSPNTTGHPATDHLRIVALVELALDFAEKVLAPGGAFVAKVFQGGTEQNLLAEVRRRFSKVRHIKPPASRKESAETYLVATGYRGGS